MVDKLFIFFKDIICRIFFLAFVDAQSSKMTVFQEFFIAKMVLK